MVAWEQQIEERSIPAWRDKYVAYARLKRKLEQLQLLADAQSKGEGHAKTRCMSKHISGISGTDEVESGDEGTPRSKTAKPAKDSVPMSPTRGMEKVKKSKKDSVSSISIEDPLIEEGDRISEDLLQKQEEFLQAVYQELERVGQWYQEMVTSLEARVNKMTGSGSEPAGAAGLSSCLSEGLPEHLAALHLEAVRLTDFVMLNVEALRKIVKKMDKQCKTSFQKSFVEDHLKRSPLACLKAAAPFNGERARACRRALEQLVSPERLEELRSQALNFGGAGLSKLAFSPQRTFIAFALALAAVPLCSAAFDAHHHRAQRCVGLLVFTVTMWISEAAPFEATAMLVAPLASSLDLLGGEREDQAKILLGAVFNDSLYLVLSGFVISSVFSKCQLDCRAADYLQRRLGHKPFLFMLAIMFLGMGLSALVSNVTAPLLLVEVLKPLLRDLPTDSRYSRALLLGLAFSCNIGGMMTPISSPQNVASLQALRQSGGSISWFEWLSVSIPFCSTAILVAWGLLMAVYRFDCSPEEAARTFSEAKGSMPQISAVVFEREDITSGKVAALVGASVTLATFACRPVAEFFGGTSSVALLFVALALGSGAISRQTFNSYSWHLLFLIGGGSALGLAVRESGLLLIVIKAVKRTLSTSPWLLVAELVLVLVGATTFVSHTVAALVLMPLIVELGQEAGVVQLAVLVGAFGCSVACALPMTSFPNVNSLMAVDDVGKPWLSMKHFLAAGIPTTVMLAGLLVTVGYGLARLVLADAVTGPLKVSHQ